MCPNSVALPFRCSAIPNPLVARPLGPASFVRESGVGCHLTRGHHRAACATAGVLGWRGFAPESAAARVCEAGARVSLNVRVQDMDLARPNALNNIRVHGCSVGSGHNHRFCPEA